MTRPQSAPAGLNLLGGRIPSPPVARASEALSGLRAAVAKCPNTRERIREYHRVTGARFSRLSGAARSYAARHGMCRPGVAGMEGWSLAEDVERTKSAYVAAGAAWWCRHHVSMALAYATWPEALSPEEEQAWRADYRAECRRVRLQSIRELVEVLS